jgi:hypothetical protein
VWQADSYHRPARTRLAHEKLLRCVLASNDESEEVPEHGNSAEPRWWSTPMPKCVSIFGRVTCPTFRVRPTSSQLLCGVSCGAARRFATFRATLNTPSAYAVVVDMHRIVTSHGRVHLAHVPYEMAGGPGLSQIAAAVIDAAG